MQEILQLVLDMLELKDFVREMLLELNAELENVKKKQQPKIKIVMIGKLVVLQMEKVVSLPH